MNNKDFVGIILARTGASIYAVVVCYCRKNIGVVGY
jgi:hypothetical protein